MKLHMKTKKTFNLVTAILFGVAIVLSSVAIIVGLTGLDP
ncbi:hypothetical protein AHiyo8_49130 [Arthrobacter sp. Hiyo8]|nr:hypothetical protein AHiyo8_49130 [Arthrobacter sp. Hiyo8]